MPDFSLIDTHSHLNDERFSGDLDEVISRANAAGVARIVVCGYDLPSSRAAVEMAARYDCVFATVGVHPHDAKSYDTAVRDELEELSRRPKVLAIGEIGLDFHYCFSPKESQVSAFRSQIALAGEVGLPIIVHSRESDPEALQVLGESAANVVGGVFHCFSGDMRSMRDVLEMGLYIGVDGPVTFKRAEALREIVEACPVERLLVETDSPYLAPVPFRGKRNEPAYVVYVAEVVAAIKGMTLRELAEATSENAGRLFGPKRLPL